MKRLLPYFVLAIIAGLSAIPLLAVKVGQAAPDFTATALACALDASLENQAPKDGSAIVINKETKVVLKIHNSGLCAWDEQTTFRFVSGDSIHSGDTATVNVGTVEPGQTTEVTLKLKPAQTNTYKSMWQIVLGDGRTVGQSITLTYKAVVPVTAAPVNTATFTPPPASPTASGGGGELQSNPTFHFCEYVPGTTDYRCFISISIRGGAPPYTIIVDGNTEWSGIASPDQDFRFYRPSRRCLGMVFSWKVTDTAGQVKSFNGFFDPTTSRLFNNNTEVCGLG